MCEDPTCGACGGRFGTGQAVAPVLCVAALITCGPRVALIRSRKPGRAWEVPGGKVKPEDGGDWRVALSREIREETALVIKPSAWSVVDVHTGPAPEEGMATIIVARTAAKGVLTAGDDAADAGWFGRDELPTPLSDLASRKVLRAWAREPPDDLRAAVLAYCDAVNAGLAGDTLFLAMESLAKFGI